MSSFRSILYWLARLLGDISAIQKGQNGKRIERRIAGKVVGRSPLEMVEIIPD